jgi:PAS domain S-box-containing protein
MVDVRRLEKDFLLNYREFGFDESRSRYVTRLVAGVAELKGNMGRIRGLAGDPQTARRTREVERALDRYQQGVEAMVDRLRERGFLEVGVHGALRAEAHEIEQAARGLHSDALLARILAVRRAEKDYVERVRDADTAAFGEALREFDAAVAAAGLPGAARAALRARGERYGRLFERYVALTEEIRTVKKGYLRSVQTIEPLLEELYVGARDRVAAKRRAIERSNRLLSLPVLLGGGLVLVLTALSSFFIALTVTRSVVESTAFAERIASGDLASRLAPRGRNEFYALATALNTMAGSLHAAASARERGLAALRESEEKYRALVETSADWIWEIDRTGRHTYSNERVREILGIGPEEIERASLPELLHPEDAPRAAEQLAASLASGRGWRGIVLRWRHRDGSWRWLESSAVAVTDADGALSGFRGTDRDVTERRRLEAELLKVQKLEAIGSLAGGIAHDFNNLLQGLFGYISLARMSLGPADDAARMLDQAEKGLALSVNLTTQLLTFAKGGRPVKRRVALAAVVEDPVKFALSGSRSDYRLDLDPGLRCVDADVGQLGQVIQNLVINASEAMPRGGTVEILARNEVIGSGVNPLVPAGGEFVRIDVRDAGQGIAERALARIFDPYFTTKRTGSGLGLATSYSIVRNHGGFIDVTSRLGEGSVFSVFLPAGGGAEDREPPAPARGTERTGKVLVMDDDELVREVAAEMIASLGHAVTTAASGEEALARYREAREGGRPFDVVVLDLTVKGGMGGEEAMRRLLEIDPGVKAVVSSGYADAAVVAEYRAHGFRARLSKPYQMEGLRDCLATLLEPPEPGGETESRPPL